MNTVIWKSEWFVRTLRKRRVIRLSDVNPGPLFEGRGGECFRVIRPEAGEGRYPSPERSSSTGSHPHLSRFQGDAGMHLDERSREYFVKFLISEKKICGLPRTQIILRLLYKKARIVHGILNNTYFRHHYVPLSRQEIPYGFQYHCDSLT